MGEQSKSTKNTLTSKHQFTKAAAVHVIIWVVMFADSGSLFGTFLKDGQIAVITASMHSAPVYVFIPYQKKPTSMRMKTITKEK